MKKGYVKPEASVEEFLANEYVAGCYGKWTVACEIDASNTKDENNKDLEHTADHCGLGTNQVITVQNSKAVSMTEIGTDGLGNLTCTVYTDATYSTKISRTEFSDIHGGDYIYWTTSAGTRTWHHQGWVTGAYTDHPNRS